MALLVSLNPEVVAALSERARAAGMELPAYAARVLERHLNRPTLIDLGREIAANVQRHGIGDETIAELLEREKHEARERKRGIRFNE